MTPAEAARLLDLPPDASPAALETRFLEIRAKLEDKIAKAPTPGLKEKYRASLNEATAAFEILTLAADGAGLPVLERAAQAAAQRPAPAAGGAPPSAASRQAPAAKPGREFIIVTLVTLLVLGGGGWWIAHTRMEAAERERLAKVEKEEAERLAKLAKEEAERQAAEQRRLEAEEKARAESEFALLRASQAELRIRWETLEKEVGAFERRLAELKSDLRSADKLSGPEQAELRARYMSHEEFVAWLQPFVLRHPARTTLAKLEALLSTKALVESRAAAEELSRGIAAAESELDARRTSMLSLGKQIAFVSEPSGLSYVIKDTYGRTFRGRTPIKLDLPWGATRVAIDSPGPSWAPVDTEVVVQRDTKPDWVVRFGTLKATVASTPPGLEFELTNPLGLRHTGRTPFEIPDLPSGPVHVVMRQPGWTDLEQEWVVEPGKPAELRIDFTPVAARIISSPPGAGYVLTNAHGLRREGMTPAEEKDLPGGPVDLLMTRAGWTDVRGNFTLKAGDNVELGTDFIPADLTVGSEPEGAEIWDKVTVAPEASGGEAKVKEVSLGVTPTKLRGLPAGPYRYLLKKQGYLPIEVTGVLEMRSDAKAVAVLMADPLATPAYTVEDLGLEMVRVSPGKFIMGSTDEASPRSNPPHATTLSRPYLIGRYEVTLGQWRAIMDPGRRDGYSLRHPVVNMTWGEAQAFCNKLTERERSKGRLPAGYVYRLPTEAEWEHACRAGSKTPFSGNGNLDDMGWYAQNSDRMAFAGGRKLPNAWGLHDMHGNVWEWCHDWNGGYPVGPVTDPWGPDMGVARVIRGGSALSDPTECQSHARGGLAPDQRGNFVGFRLALGQAR